MFWAQKPWISSRRLMDLSIGCSDLHVFSVTPCVPITYETRPRRIRKPVDKGVSSVPSIHSRVCRAGQGLDRCRQLAEIIPCLMHSTDCCREQPFSRSYGIGRRKGLFHRRRGSITQTICLWHTQTAPFSGCHSRNLEAYPSRSLRHRPPGDSGRIG